MRLIKFVNILKLSFLLTAVLAFGCSAFLLASRFQDEEAIREAVSGHLISRPGTGIFVEELTSWVFQNKGFRKNQGNFLLKSLGPTPRQVLDNGGDCADKSRLLSAILRLYGVDSTLVTLFGCAQCGPTHIVVEARYDKGWMVADPVFDMVFPSDELTYYNVDDLKANPALLINRLDQLTRARDFHHPVRSYRRDSETYTWARYINWDKMEWSQNLAQMLTQFNIDLSRLRRPYFLEDPKLILSGITGLAGITALLFWLIMRLWAARLAVTPSTGPVTGRRIVGSAEHCPD
jgi:hypothetical protein